MKGLALISDFPSLLHWLEYEIACKAPLGLMAPARIFSALLDDSLFNRKTRRPCCITQGAEYLASLPVNADIARILIDSIGDKGS